jgi:hypothetical protein
MHGAQAVMYAGLFVVLLKPVVCNPDKGFLPRGHSYFLTRSLAVTRRADYDASRPAFKALASLC